MMGGFWPAYLIANEHTVPMDASRGLLAPVAQGEIRVIDGWSGKIYGSAATTGELGADLSIRLVKQEDVMHSDNAPSGTSAHLPPPLWEIALPLCVEGQVVGALCFQVLEFSGFALEDCSSLQWLANQIARHFPR